MNKRIYNIYTGNKVKTEPFSIFTIDFLFLEQDYSVFNKFLYIKLSSMDKPIYRDRDFKNLIKSFKCVFQG